MTGRFNCTEKVLQNCKLMQIIKMAHKIHCLNEDFLWHNIRPNSCISFWMVIPVQCASFCGNLLHKKKNSPKNLFHASWKGSAKNVNQRPIFCSIGSVLFFCRVYHNFQCNKMNNFSSPLKLFKSDSVIGLCYFSMSNGRDTSCCVQVMCAMHE